MRDTTGPTTDLGDGRGTPYDNGFFGHPFTPGPSGRCVWEGGPIGMTCGADGDHEWHLMFGRKPHQHTTSEQPTAGDTDG